MFWNNGAAYVILKMTHVQLPNRWYLIYDLGYCAAGGEYVDVVYICIAEERIRTEK